MNNIFDKLINRLIRSYDIFFLDEDDASNL